MNQVNFMQLGFIYNKLCLALETERFLSLEYLKLHFH